MIQKAKAIVKLLWPFIFGVCIFWTLVVELALTQLSKHDPYSVSRTVIWAAFGSTVVLYSAYRLLYKDENY